jgi:hypothetical protein
MNPFRTAEDYERFLYNLTFVRIGVTLARVAGELTFDYGIRLVVRERVLSGRLPITLDWYDCQAHPHEPNLQSTHPHHKTLIRSIGTSSTK